MKAIKEACKNNTRDLALVNFLYSTGCRISEAASVKIDDIDFDNKKLIVLGKGNKQRVVYLTKEACDTLTDYIAERDDNNNALFLSFRGKPLTPSSFRDILHRIEDRSGVENIHPHRFRRTLATDLLNKGMAIQDVSKILGHANISVTQRYYYHLDEKVENEFRIYLEI